MQNKQFENWIQFKRKLDESVRTFYAHQREVWWCSLGVNIGTEVDGKNESFERPVIIMKAYNKESAVVLPLTTKPQENVFHFKLTMNKKTVWAKLTQTRVVSTKRLSRKVDLLDKSQFEAIKLAWKKFL